MVNICAVPNCKNAKATLFKFPNSEELQKKWTRAIHRDNFSPTKHSRVSELFLTFLSLTQINLNLKFK